MVLKIRTELSHYHEKKILSHAVQHRAGYFDELKKYDQKTIQKLESVEFLHRGQTLKSYTYSITKLGDRYFKDVYGSYKYYVLRLKGLFTNNFKIFK